MQASLKEVMQQMEELAIIRKSSLPYSSPVVVLKKKDRGNRICVHFRRLNKVTIIDPQPVPSPADSFLGMRGDRHFSNQSINQSMNQSNFYSANIPGEVRLIGATAKSMFNSKIEETLP